MGFKLEDIDKNFKLESTLGLEDIKYYDAKQAPFAIYHIQLCAYPQSRIRQVHWERGRGGDGQEQNVLFLLNS